MKISRLTYTNAGEWMSSLKLLWSRLTEQEYNQVEEEVRGRLPKTYGAQRREEDPVPHRWVQLQVPR